MTTILGIRGKDFITIASDSQVTRGNLRLPFPFKKIQIVGSNLIASTGSVGYCQRVLNYALRDLRLGRIEADNINLDFSVEELNRALAQLNFSMPLEHKHFNPFAFLVGGLNEEDKPCLFSVGDDGSIIEVPSFYCDGSGGDFALSLIQKSYKPEITKEEAANLCVEALEGSTKADVYTNSQIHICTLYLEGDKWMIWQHTGESVE